MKRIVAACIVQMLFGQALLGMKEAVLTPGEFDIFLARNSFDPLLPEGLDVLGMAFSKGNPRHEYPVKGVWEYKEDDCADHVTPAELRLYIDLSAHPVQGKQALDMQRLLRKIRHEERRMGGAIAQGELYYDGEKIAQPFAYQTRFVVPAVPGGRKEYSYLVQEMVTENVLPKQFQGYKVVHVEPLIEGEAEGFYSGKRPLNHNEQGKVGLKKDSLIYSDGKGLYLPYVVQQVYTKGKQEESMPFLIVAIHEQGKVVLSPHVSFLISGVTDANISGRSFPEGVWQRQWETVCDGKRLEKWIPVKMKTDVTEDEDGITLAVQNFDQTFLPAFGEVDRVFFERCLRSSSLLKSSYGVEDEISRVPTNDHRRFAQMLTHAMVNRLYCVGWPQLPAPVDNTKRDNSRSDFHRILETVLEEVVANDALNTSINPAFVAAAKLLLGYCKEKFGDVNSAIVHYFELQSHPKKQSFSSIKATADSLLAINFHENSALVLPDGKPGNSHHYGTQVVREQDVNNYAKYMAMAVFAHDHHTVHATTPTWEMYLHIAHLQDEDLVGKERALVTKRAHMNDNPQQGGLTIGVTLKDANHIDVNGNYGDMADEKRRTLLGRAAGRYNHLPAMRILCEQLHADPNARDLMGYTSLHRVVSALAGELVEVWAVKALELLLEQGADINAKVIDTGKGDPHIGRTPIMIALGEKRMVCALFLANRGADLTIPPNTNFAFGQLNHIPDERELLLFLRERAGLKPFWY